VSEENLNDAVKRIEESLAALRRGPRRMGRKGHPQHEHRGSSGVAAGAHAGRMRGTRNHFGHAAKFRMLEALTKNQPSTVGELSEQIDVDQPRASRLAMELEEQGMLSKTQDPQDARRYVISITTKGASFLEEVTNRRKQATIDALAGFTEAETAQFADLLGRFVRNLTSRQD